MAAVKYFTSENCVSNSEQMLTYVWHQARKSQRVFGVRRRQHLLWSFPVIVGLAHMHLWMSAPALCCPHLFQHLKRVIVRLRSPVAMLARFLHE